MKPKPMHPSTLPPQRKKKLQTSASKIVVKLPYGCFYREIFSSFKVTAYNAVYVNIKFRHGYILILRPM